MSLRYFTAGESHSAFLTGIIDGMPAGVKVSPEDFAALLRRRRTGYGRGARQKIEQDEVRITAGVREGYTTGAPISLLIENAESAGQNSHLEAFTPHTAKTINVPLPGHADLPGVVKYGLDDCRTIRERASARETVMRTALSVFPRRLLADLGIKSLCLVESLGNLTANIDYTQAPDVIADMIVANGADFITPDAAIIPAWRELVDAALAKNESLGGTAAVMFWNLPIGMGSHTQYDLRLDARLAALLMSIPAVKGVEIGMALQQARGSSIAADPILFAPGSGWSHQSNFAGGLEGGMTNGAPLVLRFHMKPLPANSKVDSVNLKTGQPARPEFYRSDTQAVTAAAVVAESVVAVELTSQLLAMTGGATLQQIHDRLTRLREAQSLLPG
ncbi:MAG: chorismate synthase [Candidatus Riflebacteria bacterium]|nr:chorismate synthase [Candidatus Riflebacteria bacterium]